MVHIRSALSTAADQTMCSLVLSSLVLCKGAKQAAVICDLVPHQQMVSHQLVFRWDCAGIASMVE